MAQTTSTTQANLHLSEVLGRAAMEEARPRVIAGQFANMYDIAGRNADNLKLNRFTDVGPATTATEGTTFSTVTTMGVETPVTLTPTEAAVMLAELTDDAIELVGGYESARAIAQSGSLEQQVLMLSDTAARLNRSALEKFEADMVAEFANATTSVGATTVDIDLGVFEEAIYSLDIAEIPGLREYVACLHPRQVSDLRRALAVNSGGLQGSVHVGQIVDRIENPMNFAFSLLGVDVFGYDKSAEVTANTGADVVGAMFKPGYGNPEDPQGGSGEIGALQFCQGRRKQYSTYSDHKERSVELMVNWKYDIALRDADLIVKIVTDA